LKTLLSLFVFVFSCSAAFAQTPAQNIAKAQSLYNKHEYKKERKFLDKCLKEDKYYAEYYFMRAECNYGLKKITDAHLDIDRAINLAPDSMKYRITKAQYYEAVLEFTHFLGSEYVIQFDLALATLKSGLPAAKNAKDSSAVIDYMGIIREEMGDTAGAIKDLHTAVRLDSTNVAALNDLAGVYNDLDSVRLCLFYAQKALALDSSNSVSYNSIAIAYMSMGEYAAAIPYLSKCIILDSISTLTTGYYDGTAYDNRSECKLETGDVKGALEDAKRSIAIQPAEPHIYANLARIYEVMGDKNKACEALDKALGWGYTEYYGEWALYKKEELCGK
jgi:tetratricopeptide (TPR) repeat protein